MAGCWSKDPKTVVEQQHSYKPSVKETGTLALQGFNDEVNVVLFKKRTKNISSARLQRRG
jgi:hypothetical protein